MKKLKVAVGVYGDVVFLEKFPDDEEHGGLNDMLLDCHREFDAVEGPGVYMATMGMTSTGPDWTGDYDAYLDILKLEPVDVR